MMKKKCQRCDTQLIKSSNYCHRCGERVSPFPESLVTAEKPIEQELPAAAPSEERTEEIPVTGAGTTITPQLESTAEAQPQTGLSSEEVPSASEGVSTQTPSRGSSSCLKIFIIVLIVVIGIAIVSLCAFGGYYLYKSDLIRGLFALLSY